MAMVTLSQRNPSYIPSIDNYQNSFSNSTLTNKPQSSKESNKKEKNEKHPPFNSVCPRLSLITNKLTPGPGAYDNLGGIKPRPPLSYIEDNQFSSRVDRFKTNQNEEALPGPGAYDILNSKRSCPSHKKKPLSASVNYNKNPLTNICTIPTKDNMYGYKFNEDGSLIVVEDPEKQNWHSGRKDDSVGPGHYYPRLLKERNAILNWDKMSPRKLSEYSKSTDDVSIIEELKTNDKDKIKDKFQIVDACKINSIEYNNEKIEKRNKRLYNHKEFVQQVMKKRAQLFQNRNIYKELPENPIEEQIRRLQQEKEKEKESKREYALNFNKLRYQQKPFQCFLSSSKKDLSYIKIDNDIKAGPGSYYKEPTYKLVKSKSCVIERMLLQSQKPIIVPKKFDYVGPGSYNIAGNLLKKSFSSYQSFENGEKRFPNQSELTKNIVPGPGAYSLPNNNWSTKNVVNENLPKFYFISQEKPKREEINGPTFNSYQPPKVINLIQNDIEKKKNIKQSILAPFSSMEKRLKESKSTNDIGPGYYQQIHINRPNSCIINFDKGTIKRKIGKETEWEKSPLGPGEYIKNSYFDWNKKSFNIMFI